MVDLVALRSANSRRWTVARLTRNFTSIAKALVAPSAKARYIAVSKRTGVPWWFIAVVHERESSQSWFASLAQGDPWNKVSVHVPAGRGPFPSWEEAAVDALVNCAPFAAKNKDWSIGAALTLLEEYNGLGYAMRGIPSPYVWSGTDQYKSGKYIRDGVFDADTIDVQPGCAGLLLAMISLDGSIDLIPTLASPPIVPDAPITKVEAIAKESRMPVPSQAQVVGQLQIIIPALGTIVSALGFSGTTANHYVDLALSIVGPISYVIVAFWGMAANSRASIMAKAAQPVAAGVAPPQIVLPKEEADLAQKLPDNVNTTETKKVVSQ